MGNPEIYTVLACIKDYRDTIIGFELLDKNNITKLIPLNTFMLLMHERKIESVIIYDNNKAVTFTSAVKVINETNERRLIKHINTFSSVDIESIRELILEDGGVNFKKVDNIQDKLAKARVLGLKSIKLNEHLAAIVDNSQNLKLIFDTDKIYISSGKTNTNLRFSDMHIGDKFRTIDLSNISFELLGTMEAMFRDIKADSIIFGEQDATNVVNVDYAFEYANIVKLDMMQVKFKCLSPSAHVFAGSIIKDRRIPASLLSKL